VNKKQTYQRITEIGSATHQTLIKSELTKKNILFKKGLLLDNQENYLFSSQYTYLYHTTQKEIKNVQIYIRKNFS